MSYELSFEVERGDFETAGEASRKIKRTLQQLGISNKVIRKVSIAGYEGEMNLAIHSWGGKIVLEVGEDTLILTIEDTGPGIKDLDLAMTEGWSTAGEEVRQMGFGAGMGLPNMKNNADNFQITSKIDEGTKIVMSFLV
ncbi:ATP-binding protein [Acetobacterium woodii]|uniref:Putative anti-sigma regulatory factor, serine/threonine protein kinase n=1 Tax=Acetobacterium woodii (strain ATCC 29683 / DSM 1030 / JCM 2381 / KCTC 1655 / WB1) TaxID=931626 RepID=H6LFH1_ACEWD|nr:ATP-binding protein [Acetobacterium woodii]AFA49458.1 putative anti-sigma regulatory factor, serine/threonine protein kinase [Acetobacterium woodii DSM 1030]